MKKILDLKTAQHMLMFNFLFMVGLSLLLVVMYECEVFEPTDLANDAQLVFGLQILMEFFSIVVIPIALKMFAIKAVHRRLVAGKGAALLRWGTARLNLLCLPMLIDTFLYYQTMWPGFGYLAIILFLCLFFVFPSMGRCESETSEINQ